MPAHALRVAAGALALALAPAASAQDCADCHGAPRFAPALRGSTHASLMCVDCHTDLRNAHRKVEGAPRAAESCARCHEQTAEEYGRSVHATAARAGSTRTPTCATCHGEPHAIASHAAVREPSHRIEALQREVELCGRCHADPELARSAGLSAAVVETYESSMHGARARAGWSGAAICTECHGRHAILAPTDPAGPLFIERRAEVCATCHPGVNRSFAASFEHLPATRSAFPAAFWIKEFFAWMVLIVSGLLAIHVFLDVQATLRTAILERKEGRHA